MKRIIGIGVLVILWGFALGHRCFAEDLVHAKSSAWPTRVTLGDEIRFYIQIERPLDYLIEPPSIKADLRPFEIKKIQMLPALQRGGGARDSYLMTLTVFDLGDLQIPPLAIRYKDGGGKTGQLLTAPVAVHVAGVPKRPSDRDDIRPIKSPFSFDLSFLRTAGLSAAAFLLTLFLILKIMRRRRLRKLMDLESRKPPHERIFLELGRLKQKNFLAEGRAKEYYSEFADILRRYLERRFGVETLELTTFEAIQKLKEKEFERALSDKIKNILENSDLVKFARYIPPNTLADELETVLKQIVEATKPIETKTKP